MKELVQKLVDLGYLRTSRIIEAFSDIDREDFVPEEEIPEAHGNYPLPIGYGQTISQPLTVAFMLELLEPKPGDRILDIGSGSGWQTAILSHIVGESGHVYALEIISRLSKIGEENCQKYSFVKKGIATFHVGDGWLGLPDYAPFDKIIIAAAAEEVPKDLLDQLKVGGRLVAPIGHPGLQDIVLIEKHGEDSQDLKEERFPGFTFVPLVKP